MTTPLLGITELEAAQAQPEIIINLAIRILEAMSPLQVLDRDVSAPPGSPTDGDRYLVPDSASGAWAAHINSVALSVNGEWNYLVPRPGWRCYVEDEDVYLKFAAGSPTGWEVD